MIGINIALILISIIFGFLPLTISFFKNKKNNKELLLKKYIADNKYLFILGITLSIAGITRLAFLDLLPSGLNQDEASAGYEAYSILKTGHDRNGFYMPVHFMAWGSGQNAFYIYLLVPFIAIFGLSTFSVRFPLALCSVFTIYAVTFYTHKYWTKRNSLLAVILLTIMPWHLMNARFAVESNIFPLLILTSFLLLLYSLNECNKVCFYLSACIFGLSSYSYGTSYFFLPIFIISLLVYLFIKKKVKLYEAAIYIVIIAIVSLPIIMFIFINTFNKNSFTFLFMSIPKMRFVRFGIVTNLFSGNFFKTLFPNILNSLKIVFLQTDGYYYCHSIPGLGTTYIFAIPLLILGFFNKKSVFSKIEKTILVIWLIASVLLSFAIDSSVIHINIIWIPILFLSIDGIAFLFDKKNNKIKWTIRGAYTASFLALAITYSSLVLWKAQYVQSTSYSYSLDQAYEYATKLNKDNYYISEENMNYARILFYSKYDVDEFIKTRVIVKPGEQWERIIDFGNYHFYMPSTIEENDVVIANDDDYNKNYKDLDKNKYKTQRFKFYTVIYS